MFGAVVDRVRVRQPKRLHPAREKLRAARRDRLVDDPARRVARLADLDRAGRVRLDVTVEVVEPEQLYVRVLVLLRVVGERRRRRR